MYRSRRMTDGSLKLMETARISRSYTEMTSTFPWHQSVTAFCQWTIFRGSYDAFRRSVCSKLLEFCPTPHGVSMFWPLWYKAAGADRRGCDSQDSRFELARGGGARPGGLFRRVRIDRRGPQTVPDARQRGRPGGARRAVRTLRTFFVVPTAIGVRW